MKVFFVVHQFGFEDKEFTEGKVNAVVQNWAIWRQYLNRLKHKAGQ